MTQPQTSYSYTVPPNGPFQDITIINDKNAYVVTTDSHSCPILNLRLKWTSNNADYNGNFLNFDTSTGRLKYDNYGTTTEDVYIYW